VNDAEKHQKVQEVGAPLLTIDGFLSIVSGSINISPWGEDLTIDLTIGSPFGLRIPPKPLRRPLSAMDPQTFGDPKAPSDFWP